MIPQNIISVIPNFKKYVIIFAFLRYTIVTKLNISSKLYKVVTLMVTLLLLAGTSHAAVNFTVPESVLQGEPFVVKIFTDELIENPAIHWLGKTAHLTNKQKNGKIAVILATDALQKSGKQKIAFTFRLAGKNFEFQKFIMVKEKHYPRESLRVNPSKVNFSSRIKKRLAKEKEIYAKIVCNSTQGGNLALPLARPCRGQVSSAYGNIRIFNGKPFGFHGGTDFRAATGTKIKSVAAGRVCLVSHFYLTGGIIIIDHGAGLFSSYCHLSKKLVKVGDLVKRGQVIALSGASGRVTGPHLHFEMSWCGVKFNATSLLEK